MLTPKNIRIAIKEGYGTLYLIKRYDLAGEKQLFDFVERWFTDSDRIISVLRKNQRNMDKKKEDGKSKSKASLICPETLKAGASLTRQDTGSLTVTLASLLEQEQKQIKLLRKLEAERLKISNSEKGLSSDLEEEKRVLSDLERKLANQQAIVKGLLEEHADVLIEKSRINDAISSAEVQLDNLRKQIKELQLVNIFFYGDGHIEVENGELRPVAEKKILKGFDKLLLIAESEGFTIRVVKGLVKLHELIEDYKKQGICYELIFDSSSLEEFWKKVSCVL